MAFSQEPANLTFRMPYAFGLPGIKATLRAWEQAGPNRAEGTRASTSEAKPMCVILPFARQRFTPMDMVACNAILADRRRRGLWQKMERSSSRERDWILVWLPGLKDPSLRLERDAQGTYRLSCYDGQGWFQFRQGPVIIDCLAHVEPTVRLHPAARKAD